ncbi:MAG TPA: hypothetical protein VE422_45395, partial [Terriglobia bacterium]|nr:hypothetical protein [Terriglobia bacterium]
MRLRLINCASAYVLLALAYPRSPTLRRETGTLGSSPFTYGYFHLPGDSPKDVVEFICHHEMDQVHLRRYPVHGPPGFAGTRGFDAAADLYSPEHFAPLSKSAFPSRWRASVENW